MFYEQIISRFNAAGVRYAIVGGVAVNLHGYVRMTTDLDILLLMEDTNIAKAIQVLMDEEFTCKIPIDPAGLADPATRQDWIENKNLKALNFYRTPQEVDIVVVSPVLFEVAEKLIFLVRGVKYPVLSIKDLIRMKAASNRAKDQEDIRQLELLQEIKQQQ